MEHTHSLRSPVNSPQFTHSFPHPQLAVPKLLLSPLLVGIKGKFGVSNNVTEKLEKELDTTIGRDWAETALQVTMNNPSNLL